MTKGHIIYKESSKGIRVLKIVGSFTKETIPDLRKICYKVGSDVETEAVLLDLGKTTKIDTSAFACVVGFIRDHMKHGINICVVSLKKGEKKLAEILKVDKAIRQFGTTDEAIEAITKERGF
jgi:anti-anti-sigma regulatory factor